MPQTKVALTNKTDLKGVIKSQIMKSLAPRFLSVSSDMRKKFDNSRAIDAYNRLQIVAKMKTLTVDSSETFDDTFKDVEGMSNVNGR